MLCRATKDAEIERIVDNEAVVRKTYEQQIAAEQQQFSAEKDVLQKALQEQQGTAFALQQQQQERICDLEQQLQAQEASHAFAAAAQNDAVAKLQASIAHVQQQLQDSEQDVRNALAYRQKCVAQKATIQQLELQLEHGQHSIPPAQASANKHDPIDLTKVDDKVHAKAGKDAVHCEVNMFALSAVCCCQLVF